MFRGYWLLGNPAAEHNASTALIPFRIETFFLCVLAPCFCTIAPLQGDPKPYLKETVGERRPFWSSLAEQRKPRVLGVGYENMRVGLGVSDSGGLLLPFSNSVYLIILIIFLTLYLWSSFSLIFHFSRTLSLVLSLPF